MSGAVRRTFETTMTVGRLARDLPGFLRERITVEQATEAIRDRLARRTERFLLAADRAIYGYPDSPYLRLLRGVGCELGDLRALVAAEGVEGALARLASDGVYVTFDEFKGRREIVRGSLRFTPSDADFDNPRLRPHYFMTTGGTRGTPTRVKRSLGTLREMAEANLVLFDAHGLSEPIQSMWSMIPPMSWFIVYAKIDQPMAAWFYPIRPLPARIRLTSRFVKLIGHLNGCAVPGPVFVDLRRPARLAAWLGVQTRQGRPVCLYANPSSAVRLATAATDAGLSLAGVHILTDGEPITPARRRLIEAAGARVIVRYATMEIPILSMGCADPRGPDDVHVVGDQLACGLRSRKVGEDGPPVDALVFSSLSLSAPKILFNTETGDQARLERRACGCKLGELGWRDHLVEIRSFEKLSGEGMTFATSNLLHVVDEILPRRFGGTALDYQLVEQEADGIARLALLVHPRLGPVDESAVQSTFLEALAREGTADRYMADLWRRARTVRVQRQPPLVTAGGKTLPFHLLGVTTG